MSPLPHNPLGGLGIKQTITIYEDGSLDVDGQPPIPPAPLPKSITDIKKMPGVRIAALLHDSKMQKWGYAPRQVGLNNPPQTYTFNEIKDTGKGSVIPLTDKMLAYLYKLNGSLAPKILIPAAGWKNTTNSVIQCLTWSCDLVLITERVLYANEWWVNAYAPDCNDTSLWYDANGQAKTFFDKDQRLIVHKFNAINQDTGNLIKLGNGYDIYTPFVANYARGGKMWTRERDIEYLPALPFTLDDGSQVVEYEFYGFEVHGLRNGLPLVILKDKYGFKLPEWGYDTPEVPV